MQEPTYSVGELAAALQRMVGREFPEEIWVHGEIRDLDRAPSGHVYFTLVDPLTGAATPSQRLPVALFASDRVAVNRMLARNRTMRMSDGVEVRIRGRVSYFDRKSTIQLRMTWIDADYTLGRLAADRDRVLRRLSQLGLLERNRRLPFPTVPLRVGLVTSAGSAAEADVLHELERSGYGFLIVTADARMQGPGAPASISRALAAVVERGVDVAVLARGGGARTELAAFDNEEVAVTIARLPVPVVTGIGHETDSTIADEVAAVVAKTPTAAAGILVEAVGTFAAALDLRWRAIVEGARHASARGAQQTATVVRHLGTVSSTLVRTEARDAWRLHQAIRRGAAVALTRHGRRIEGLVTSVEHAGRRRIEEGARRVVTVGGRLRPSLQRALRSADAVVEGMATRVSSLDPQRALGLGWSFTTGPRGTVRSAADVAVGDRLVTTVADGAITSRVEDTRFTESP